MKYLKKLTIITITYNNLKELKDTTKSLLSIIKFSNHLIINGGNEIFNSNAFRHSKIINSKDKGIYDAINIGIKKVVTQYFMLIHSGDVFISKASYMNDLLFEMDKDKLDLYLNDSLINFYSIKRNYRSKLWHPWMFTFGVQPPHLPIIYNTTYASKFNYNIKNKIIGDFEYLEKIFNEIPKYKKGNKFIIEMNDGGKTTSGLYSFILVTFEFIKIYGPINGAIKGFFRLPIKLLLSF